MWGFGLYSPPMDSFLLYIPFKDKIDAGKTLRSVSLCGVGLCAVLANFGFSKIYFYDSARANTM